MPRTFQISAPANYFVADSAELLCAGQTRGYASFNINSENYTLEPKNFTVTYDLQAGHNVLNIWTDDGTVRLKRQILRLRTLAELQEQGLAADLAQSVFAPEQRRDFRDSKISLSDFAAYAVQTLGLRLPQDFDGIFNDTDILYFNGYLGKTSGGLLNAGSGYFSLGRLAEMLARIDGYGDVLDSADDGRVKAVEILAATGYYTPEDFQPADGEVTLAQAQSLLLRTSAVNRRLAEEFPGYPLVWLDRAELAKGRVVLRLYNAGLLAGYKWTYGRQSVSGSISAEEQINIAPEISAAGTLNIEVYDKPGKVWRFQTALAPLPKDALFLVRAEPRRPEAGLPLKLLFAVPDGLAADSIKLSADIISNIVSLKRVSGNLWQTETRLPDTLNTGEYILRFTVSAAGTEYEKIYPLNVRGFESADRPDVQTANRKVIAKVSAEKIKPGDTLYIYAGVVAGANPVKEMRIVRPGQADVLAGRYKDRLWRAVISGFAAGRNDYRAVAVFQDGSTAEHSGVFWYEGPSTYKTVPSVPSAVSHNATPPPPAEKPRLNKVYYPVEIMLSPAKPRPGGALQIRAKYAAPEVRDVYAEIQKQVIPLKKNGAVWQAEYTLPEKRQELYIKIYSRDARGNLSMTEKSLAF
jgi:hypothetical protein